MDEPYPMKLSIEHLRDTAHIESLKEIVQKDVGANLQEVVSDPKDYLATKSDYIEAELVFGNIDGALKHTQAANEFLKSLK